MTAWLAPLPPAERAAAALLRAAQVCDEDVAINRGIGAAGLPLIRGVRLAQGARRWRSTSSRTAMRAGSRRSTWAPPRRRSTPRTTRAIPIHVWVDETRPRNQGASLTAWELLNHGVAHTVISDNAGGHLMQHGQVDMVIVGTDRTTATGDVCNKIGTYLKALAARDNGVAFYAARAVALDRLAACATACGRSRSRTGRRAR